MVRALDATERAVMRLNLFGSLMPREEAFVALFCELSVTVLAAAREFEAMLVEAQGTVPSRFAAIERIEHQADAVARRILIAGNRTFNAPLDRENIMTLAHELDDVVDLVEEAAKEIMRYEVREFPPQMKEMAAAITRSAEKIKEAMPLLGEITREHRRILALCEAVGNIEDAADDWFDKGLTELRAQLRRGAIDTIAYIDLKEIYEHLEAVVDKCDDVANEIATITAKHV
jgi:predicted phosphate transport protein (TIGR00153 family)